MERLPSRPLQLVKQEGLIKDCLREMTTQEDVLTTIVAYVYEMENFEYIDFHITAFEFRMISDIYIWLYEDTKWLMHQTHEVVQPMALWLHQYLEWTDFAYAMGERYL